MSNPIVPTVVHDGTGTPHMVPEHVALVHEDGTPLRVVEPLAERPASLSSVADVVAALEACGLVPPAE